MPMNTEIKARWTAALRSGEYEQGKGYLKSHGKLCCLGVLCELAVKDGIIPEPQGPHGPLGYGYGAELNDILLPAEVRWWAGLKQASPEVNPDSLPEGVEWESSPEEDGGYLLTNANDGGTPFAVIADIIDAQL